MKIVAEGLACPEGPVAMADGSVILVEIARETLSRVTPDGRIEVVAQIPGGPNGAAVGPDGRMYVCNNGGFVWVREDGALRPHGTPDTYKGGSIEVVDIATGKVDRLYDKVDGLELSGPNDIVFDAHGGFYFTDVGKRWPRVAARGSVYYAKADGSLIKQVVSAATTPNGIGLSPDGTVLYTAETDTGRVWAWDILSPGELRKLPWPSPTGGRCVAGIGGYTRFDSLAVSASGKVCAAALESCAVIEVSPDGSHRSIGVPDMQVTNICFGGKDMRTAWITGSYGGRLFTTQWHEPGLRLNYQEI